MSNVMSRLPPILADRSAQVLDPAGYDLPGDEAVTVTWRSLARVAFVGVEVGARFHRESIDGDAFGWMTAPQQAFRGMSAIDACRDRRHFMRAIVLHGLALDLDATADEVDREIGPPLPPPGRRARPPRHDAVSAVPAPAPAGTVGLSGGGDGIVQKECADGINPPSARRLWSASIFHQSEVEQVVAFHASLCSSHPELFDRLIDRYGIDVAAGASPTRGFDPGHPLLSPVLADYLSVIDGTAHLLSAGQVEVNLERRLAL